jgi:hypothetical protein
MMVSEPLKIGAAASKLLLDFRGLLANRPGAGAKRLKVCRGFGARRASMS